MIVCVSTRSAVLTFILPMRSMKIPNAHTKGIIAGVYLMAVR